MGLALWCQWVIFGVIVVVSSIISVKLPELRKRKIRRYYQKLLLEGGEL